MSIPHINQKTKQKRGFCLFLMVGKNGLEPSTFRLSGGCSNQLSYSPVNDMGLTKLSPIH